MSYDVVIVGARPAGAATAMLLARGGLRVAAVDRARFPSDTLSTHQVQLSGVARLARWGLLDAVVASNCPATRSARFDPGPVAFRGHYPRFDGVDARLQPPPYGARHDPRGGGPDSGCRGHRGRRRGRRPDVGRPGHGHSRRGARRPAVGGGDQGATRHRRRRQALPGGAYGRRPCVRRATVPVRRRVRLLGRSRDRWRRDVRPTEPGDRRVAHERRPRDHVHRGAGRRVRRVPRQCGRADARHLRHGRRSRRAHPRGDARRTRTGHAGRAERLPSARTVRAGRSSATPVSSWIRSPARASATHCATRSPCRPP